MYHRLYDTEYHKLYVFCDQTTKTVIQQQKPNATPQNPRAFLGHICGELLKVTRVGRRVRRICSLWREWEKPATNCWKSGSCWLYITSWFMGMISIYIYVIFNISDIIYLKLIHRYWDIDQIFWFCFLLFFEWYCIYIHLPVYLPRPQY